ncbi:MAG: lipoprotein insertase outer membrane protein LolB [Gammaproteobacteria bacterium]
MKLFSLLLPVLLLAGCATTPVAVKVTSLEVFPAPGELPAHWQLSGRLSLTQGETGWHGGVDWTQAPGSYRLRVSGPLGQGGFLLSGNEQGVLLLDAGQRTYAAPDADTLLTNVTGWKLPVTGMRYWVRAIPDPASQFEAEIDAEGRLEQLSQAGWVIRYTSYHTTGDGRWPARLALVRDDVAVRMVIDQWQFGQTAAPLP